VTASAADLQQGLRRVEELLRALEGCPDAATRESARELVRALLNLHTAGLAKLLELAGSDVVARVAGDPLVSGLLLLHGLHPVPAAERVNRVLEQARPRFRAHGGEVELLEATEEVARFRLHSEPAAGVMLRALVAELVVEAVPDAAIEFEEAYSPSANGRVPLPVVGVYGPPRHGGAP
jgi:hypothetical protein